MAFGLSGAPVSFLRLMDDILTGIRGLECFVYLDDLIIFSKTIEEHADRLNTVIKRLREANLKIQQEKCVFVAQVEYLGHVFTNEGIRPDPKKIEAIKAFPVPKTVRDIRSFIGLSSYYRRFIKSYAQIATPLNELTRKVVPFVWTEKHQNSFDTLRQALCMEPVLIYPDFLNHSYLVAMRVKLPYVVYYLK